MLKNLNLKMNKPKYEIGDRVYHPIDETYTWTEFCQDERIIEAIEQTFWSNFVDSDSYDDDFEFDDDE